ncbi:bifunctional adenosylcobinamide kinase/adenosylcobinamide-phosphate guanylyltransferase [Nocardioides jiangxiensis]|uniref:Adenosylcobinamide kinase n=1 Tax=Nocardioides jiangxiensis TaxID=3064524 RepID=A0ABT9AWX8_9ACTN|nr:bifunctional adenosylcobinamide kinase/adenosylcobinamide-phosphate guanylyltransferase [Nocardioides sp. WY-20]MDO7867004.1 bifunctional adenosylcobinamide kinase/adenosylcobinamide-phosphate guanylyltransferase [Nocardioides sp. WY-20]
MKTLVIGGARSGKSRYAESLLLERPDTTYVATGYPAAEDDAAWADRVALHRARRPSTWTVEETLDLRALLEAPGGPLLVDCMTLWLTRTMDRHDVWTEDGWTLGAADLRTDVAALADAVARSGRDLVLVTNEVGQGVVPADAGTRRFVDEMGALNSALGDVVDDVVWCIAGRQVRL